MKRDRKANEVLVLAPEGERRDVLARALRKEGMTPHFTGATEKITELLEALKPATLLHDWPAVDPTVAARFHQKLGKNSAYAGLCRVIYVDALTPQLLALANDSGVRRIISRATSPAALVSAVKMAVSVLTNMPDLQRIALGEHDGSEADQAGIDAKIRGAYGLFAHDPAVQLEFAKLCVRERSFKAATEIADALIASDPQNVRALNLRGRIFLLEGKTDDALAVLGKANVLSPFSTERLVLLGDAFFAKGDQGSAAKHYCEALKLEPSDDSARNGLAGASLADGDVAAVFAMIRDSLSDEEAAALFNNAAVLAARAHKTDDSLRLYANALEVVRSDRLRAAIHFNIALAHRRSGHADKAQKHIKICLKLDPQFSKAHRYLKGRASA